MQPCTLIPLFVKTVIGISCLLLIFPLMISSRSTLLSDRDTLIGLLKIPAMSPQTTVSIPNAQNALCSIGTSVQVTLVWLVIVGQLPQFDARML